MTVPVRSQQPQPMLQSALAWLTMRPPDDPLHDLGPLKQHLKEVAEASIQPLQRLKVLELFQSRVDSTSKTLKPRLVGASLPLPHRLRSIAEGLTDIHGLLASATLRSMHELRPEDLARPVQDMPAYCTRILGNLAEQQQIALFVSTTAPNGVWVQAQEAFRLLRTIEGADTVAAERLLKGMLALVAVQPESFTAREILFLAEYLHRFATAVDIRHQPLPPLENWHWLEESRDLPPVAIVRRPPPSHGTVLYFSCATLARIAAQHVMQLANGESLATLRLPPGNDVNHRELLARAQACWLTPPRRHAHRRPSHYRVEICSQFQTLWTLMGDSAPKVSGDGTPITDWMVLNESPSGMALMHVSGPVAELVPGDTLGLRTAPGQPWNIGLIRWARSDNPEHFELGLEMISPSAVPVQIVQGSTTSAKVSPALLFPASSSLEHNETLMTARGQADIGPFTLIGGTDGKVQLTRCQMRRLALQTAKVEIFEFTRDSAPQ
ncbi:MAG TPA: hypothetical protein VFF82_00365 [Rhodocyclaceae bacterium]|nr:hypothetical protein [Rhodocyclaceae bacterium]